MPAFGNVSFSLLLRNNDKEKNEIKARRRKIKANKIYGKNTFSYFNLIAFYFGRNCECKDEMVLFCFLFLVQSI